MSTETDQVFNEYVTAMVGGQLFGLPIRRVQDVFLPDRVTKVPLASPEIGGLINLRGRIVTLVDLAHRLGLTRRGETPMAMVGTVGSGVPVVFQRDEGAGR